MSSGPTKPHRERGARRIDLALPPDEADALDARCEATGETKTAVIRLALRRELGLGEREEQ